MGLRWTEEGIDLNRNYIDFDDPGVDIKTLNTGYDDVHGVLDDLASNREPMQLFEQGGIWLSDECAGDVVSRLFQGQYRQAQGVGYGGVQSTGARRRLERILADNLSDCASSVAVIDLHTGLGPYGKGLKVSTALPDTAAAERATDWWGPDVIMLNSQSAGLPYSVIGDTGYGISRLIADREVTSLTLEFGTFDQDGLVKCVLGEYLIRYHPDRLSDKDRGQIFGHISQFFNPTSADWRLSILKQFATVVDRAVEGLLRPSHS